MSTHTQGVAAQGAGALDNAELLKRGGGGAGRPAAGGGAAPPPPPLRLALTHRSFAYENGGIPTNERLEFLGDSVLGFSVTDALFRENPDLAEGELAKRRSAVVSTRALAGVARSLGVGNFILLGQGERLTDGKNKASILADTMEALIGAVYVCHDIETARQLVMRLIGPLLLDAAAMGAATDWKTSIQEYAAGNQLGPVRYEVTGEGPDHARTYQAVLWIGGTSYLSGNGHSKKEAEQDAAANSWRQIHSAASGAVGSEDAPATGNPTTDRPAKQG